MAVLFANFASSTLAAGITGTSLVLALRAGDGKKFPLPTVTFRGRLQATRIAAAVLPPAWVFIEGDYPVDYAVNTDPTFLKPPERGGVR